MIFSIGLVLFISTFIYANVFMKERYGNYNWTDAFFGLLSLVGIGCMTFSVAVLAFQYLP